MSTKIHPLVDALGNPVGCCLTGGQKHDLAGADERLPSMQADTLVADKAYDADDRVLEPLAVAGQSPIIPPKANRNTPGRFASDRFDRESFNSGHLIENLFARLNPYRAIATRYTKTKRNFLPSIHLVAAVICSINERPWVLSEEFQAATAEVAPLRTGGHSRQFRDYHESGRPVFHQRWRLRAQRRAGVEI